MNIKSLMAGAGLIALATSAHAANTAIIIWNSADPGGFEAATGTGQASVLGSDLDGVTVSVSSVKKSIIPVNKLTEANISIDNTTGVEQTLEIIAGANGYLGANAKWKLTGTIGVTTGSADLIGAFFVDGGNSLNGQTTAGVTGVGVNSFDSGSLTDTDSFSFNGFGFDGVSGPYGLAEHLTLTLAPGASVFVQGMAMEAAGAVPEASTWLMGLAGFVFVGALGLRRKTVRNRFALEA